MDIIIIADYCGNLDDTGNSRFLYLAKLLCKENDVELITGDFNHSKKQFITQKPVDFPFNVTMLHEEGYPKNVCLKRFKSDSTWGKNVAAYLNSRKKPDVIYSAVPPLTGALQAARYCKKNNVRFVIDIQDLWPEAFKMVFNKGIISDLVFRPFNKMANEIYSSADAICAVSETYTERALEVNNKNLSGHAVFLGTDLDDFDRNARLYPFSYEKSSSDEIRLAYCGTLGASYDLICVIDALAVLKDKGINNVAFMVFGDGPRRVEFENYAEEKKINAKFFGRLPYPEMCGALCTCDITVNPIMHNAAQSIINKHADYAASGLPVINTQENEEYRNLVDNYKMGFNCENGNCIQIAENIEILLKNDALRKKMGDHARRCAEERFNRKNAYAELVNAVINF